MSLRTIIIEDEPLSRAFLNNLLKEFFPEVAVIANEATVPGAVQAIEELRPDLVFLDIELQAGTGFDVLQQTLEVPFRVIFTTALDHLAINIIRICGVDYLQKPIDIAGLRDALEVILQRDAEQTRAALDHLMLAYADNNRPSHLLLSPAERGYLPIADIISIEAKDNQACFTLRSGQQATSEKGLKEYENLLGEHAFFRSHQHCLVNTREVKAVSDDTDSLLMSDNRNLPLSPKRKEALLRIIEEI